MMLLTDLPDALFYIVLSYLDRPTGTASFMTRNISVLSKAIHNQVENDRNTLWEIILSEYKPVNTANSIRNSKEETTNRRESIRLRRRSVKEEVIYSHKTLCDRTELAIFQLSEMVNDKKNPLTLAKLRSTLYTMGPVLRVNLRAKIGGTLLVEVLRSRYVSNHGVILRCVKEIIEKHGADPNVPAAEGRPGQMGTALTPLVIAAGRGMPAVVSYLIDAGASIHEKGTTRFPLYSKPTKTVSGTYTPLEFAKALRDAEMLYGADERELRGLNECIRLLTEKAAAVDGKLITTPDPKRRRVIISSAFIEPTIMVV